MDYSFIEFAEQNKISIHQEKIQKVRESVADDFLKAIWMYVFDEKEKGSTDNEILSGLQDRGLDEAHSMLLLSGLSDKLKEIIDQFDTKMLVGGASFLIGTLVTFLTYTSVMSTGGYFFVAWGAILFDAIRCFTGLSANGKYDRLFLKIDHNET
mgnify:CR=1 FL=1